MALADPDLPPGIALPELSPDPPLGFSADRYRWLRDAFYELPRRSRVLILLQLSLPDRQPLTLRAIAQLFGVTHERIRQLERHAFEVLLNAWRPQRAPTRLSRDARVAAIATIIAAAVDRHPLGDAKPRRGRPTGGPGARGPRDAVPTKFGERVARERERQGKSMTELARIAGMHTSTISCLERGLKDLRLSTADRLARALDRPLSELVDGDREVQSSP
jgi:DNA-binding XRE family transcriptional regulator